MLHKKARPKRKSRLLKINTSKGYFSSLFSIYHDIVYTNNKFGKALINSIPVLSIFVLLGIIGFSAIGLPLAEPDGEAYAADTGSTSSLIIDNGNPTDSTTTVRNNVAYSSHTVQVSASNINGYSLKITGPTNLTGSTTITGAGNKTPANMANNTWGYAWGSTSTANTSLSYNSFTGSAQTLTGDSVSNNSINFTRKLVFAAKFSQDAVEGHYKANVKLNLAVTPKALTADFSVNYNLNGGTGGPENMSLATNDSTFTSYTYTIPDAEPTRSGYRFEGWSSDNGSTITYQPRRLTTKAETITLTTASPSVNLTAVWRVIGVWSNGANPGITTMQAMTASICTSATIGTNILLRDSRDQKVYEVAKLKDGHCWMNSNMTLDLSTVTLTPNDSDVTSNYNAGTATEILNTQNWPSSDSGRSCFKTNGYGNSGYYTAYGYYYSWRAAIAGSTFASGKDAAGSICPKGWKLPKGGTTVALNTASSQAGNDFANLMNTDGAGWSGTISGYKSWSGKFSSTIPPTMLLGGGNWYRAGRIISSNKDVNCIGNCTNYWSRTHASSYDSFAMQSVDSYLYPAYNELSDTYGLPVRCVAYSN